MDNKLVKLKLVKERSKEGLISNFSGELNDLGEEKINMQ
jgi:hypothetical protein